MVSSIYQRIWDQDQAGNGLPALRIGESRNEDRGYVIVDERTENVPVNHHVIKEIKVPDSKSHTYILCTELFNNYILDPAIQERISTEETEEEMAFIDAIVPTLPIQEAKKYIEGERGFSISDETLATMIKETWFFQGKAGSKHASGFEHVFVGEQSGKGDQPDSTAVKLGGYHFWYKYFLDDAGGRLGDGVSDKDRIIYQGTKYGGADEPDKGILVPEIITLQYQWTAPDFSLDDPEKEQLLKKSIGGFFVGCSPEGLIALGLVRCRTRAGKLALINSAKYNLDLHRLSNNNQSIRTFFPRFKSYDFMGIITPTPVEPMPEPISEPARSPVSGASIVKIIAALVNAPNPEAGRETITLINTSANSQNIGGWFLQVPNGTKFSLSSDTILRAGEIITFRLPTSDPQLRNRSGNIVLLEENQSPHHVVSYSTEQANKDGETITFG